MTNLNDDRRSKTPEKRGCYSQTLSEAQRLQRNKATESLVTGCRTENPTGTNRLMEAICEKENLKKALKRVEGKKGSSGIDGMKAEELRGYLKENWLTIKERLLSGAYTPSPVKRVEIAKPDGGVRKLGIPTVLDRFIQQAILQVLQGVYDPTFSEQSYGFRPRRSAHQAILQAHKYISAGYTTVVDIDLEKFFDRVNHDRLMGTLSKRIKDKRLLRIIRAYLNAGVMEHGLVKPTREGTPQGGNLSPLLSNIVLDELDKELEKRGHRFARYADDCNIYVRSQRAGQRVMKSITAFIAGKLKLRVNQNKSAVDKTVKRKFLGYSFTNEKIPRIRVSSQSLKRFKERVREITNRNRGVSLERLVADLSEYARGWMNYYRYCQTPSLPRKLNGWMRRRIRSYLWKQWKTFRNRVNELRKRGVERELAYQTAFKMGQWAVSNSRGLREALPDSYLQSIGFQPLTSFVKV